MDVCRHCGRPVIRGRYLAWTHSNGIPRSARPHYASPVRPTSRAAADDMGRPPTRVVPRRQPEMPDGVSPTDVAGVRPVRVSARG